MTTASRPTARNESFPQRLKAWRQARRLSQLELALRCNVSQRHLSFLESGRARPSEPMILNLSEALEVPLRDRNALLLAAGFAPRYRESDLSEPEMAAVTKALDHLLEKHEPYPALVIDHLANLQRANAGAMKLMAFLTGPDPEVPPAEDPPNLLHALFNPQGLRPYIKDWEAVANFLLRRLQAECIAAGQPQDMRDLLAALSTYPGVPKDWPMEIPGEWHAPVLTTTFEKDGLRLTFFTTITTLGTPFDVTLQEVRVEQFFPADAETEAFFLG